MTSKRPIFTSSSVIRQSHHRSRLPHPHPNTRQCHHRKLFIRTNATIAKNKHIAKNTKKICPRADRVRNNTHPPHAYRNNNNNLNENGKNIKSAAGDAGEAGAETASAAAVDPPPTARQLMIHAIRTSIPMIGFGFMDNTLMIHAGHYVDCTLGVTFGLSTLAAAGIGQIFSGVGGVVFGDALEVAFHRLAGAGRTATAMTKAQKAMRASRMAGLFGGVVGVGLGCTLGLVNLLFVDENKASLLKLQALEEGQEFEFEVEVDNLANPGYTTVRVRGPDVDGVLASITASIASCGCSVVELNAGSRRRDEEVMMDSLSDGAGSGAGAGAAGSDANDDSSAPGTTASNAASSILNSWQSQTPMRVEDTFVIRDRATQQAIDNDDLDALARAILTAAKDPLNTHSLKGQLEELEIENMALADRVLALEKMLEDRQVRVVPSSSASSSSKSERDKKE
eukprot:CAMPEP_0171364400 /NCGR_PEP_ID=MMETSP0879-20121228/4017_1 /TAXON_ID=67004 /ORGANISM="Thalassiosira weissflogii, Strain CCMP1336" /LENGTH=452 /DNA_ID=CAMNT_0011871785 /DNA_START=182 /DNA_END=1540 /DNA_ORIENTATION=+